MTIYFDKTRKLFRIDTAHMTYAFAVGSDGRLIHLHWGGRVGTDSDFDADLARL